MNKKFLGGLLAATLAAFAFEACSPAHGNATGHEYMPDMAHSIAYEPNKIDEYSLHTWNDGSVKTVTELWGSPRLPIKGTIPRGSVGLAAHGYNADYITHLNGGDRGIATPVNGNVPYYYSDNEEERTRATREITTNPFPITKTSLAKGKELYTIYCGICHGAKGAGDGYLVRDDGKYPAQPANLTLDTFANGNVGRLYHGIMYGKNVMGGYSDKLSYEERWDVIHYIRSCQAEVKTLQYNEIWNTFKPKEAVSDSLIKVMSAAKTKATQPVPATKVETGPAMGGHSTGHRR
jgi:Cytochrome C oxidase, cbb3-type, subunit III